jgi:hypothetical protein
MGATDNGWHAGSLFPPALYQALNSPGWGGISPVTSLQQASQTAASLTTPPAVPNLDVNTNVQNNLLAQILGPNASNLLNPKAPIYSLTQAGGGQYGITKDSNYLANGMVSPKPATAPDANAKPPKANQASGLAAALGFNSVGNTAWRAPASQASAPPSLNPKPASVFGWGSFPAATQVLPY